MLLSPTASRKCSPKTPKRPHGPRRRHRHVSVNRELCCDSQRLTWSSHAVGVPVNEGSESLAPPRGGGSDKDGAGALWEMEFEQGRLGERALKERPHARWETPLSVYCATVSWRVMNIYNKYIFVFMCV